MKIIHITQATSGGTYTYISDLMVSLREKGFSQALFCPKDGPLMDRAKSNGFDVEEINAVRSISPISDFKAGVEVNKAIKRYSPDMVHLHSSKAGAIGRLSFPGIPVIYTPHGWSFNMIGSKLKGSFYALTERFLSPSTEKIVAISKYEYDSAIERHICGAEKIVLIENAINLESFEMVGTENRKEIRKRYGVEDDEILIGAVGRLTESKNPQLFIEIAVAMKKHLKVKFIWVGDGELSGDMQEYARLKGVDDNIIFTGWSEEVGAHMQAMDIGLHTASWEGFGLVIAEFMATGIPVVTSAVGGIVEIIDDGVTGFLCDNDDMDSYIIALNCLIDNKELKKRMITDARCAVKENYSHERLVDQHVELYESIQNTKS